jgi:5-methylcytosine-specific restriction protein B
MNEQINTEVLKGIIREYKNNFAQINSEERYKWQAVKCFRDNWDFGASDFAKMLKNSLAKSENLLTSNHYYAKKMIVEMAEKQPEIVRQMFADLFDETKNLTERVQKFKDKSSDFVVEHKDEEPVWNATNSFQDLHAVSVYLTFMYPEKYYIFKSEIFRKFAKRISYTNVPKQGKTENLIAYKDMCDKIREIVLQDESLTEMSKARLDETCDEDKNYNMLTMDIVYFGRKDGVKYLTEIIESLKELNGQASLKNIYKKMQERDLLPYIHTNPTWKSTVSTEILRHCKGSPSYVEGNDDLFYSVNGMGGGIWGLKDYQQNSSVTDGDEPDTAPNEEFEEYTKQNFLDDVYISEDKYDKIVSLLKNKKNIILYGAPGVGKTYAAKRLAYSMIGSVDKSRVQVVQFHQSYSYEDFIMGYKPDGNGFKLRTGIFYDFCKMADGNDGDYFFIIDEINRGNMSKIFGELLMLIEKDYRGEEINLAYENKTFNVPNNVYIIGMMNTADRSLAMIDYALRRRFSFVPMEPAFDNDKFKEYREKLRSDNLNSLIKKIEMLNTDIKNDPSLGKGFEIGHSYFCNMEVCTDARLGEIVEYDIIPMLEEYWFDDTEQADKWKNELRGVVNDTD